MLRRPADRRATGGRVSGPAEEGVGAPHVRGARITAVTDCVVSRLPHDGGAGGGAVRGSDAVPFTVARVYYLYNVPAAQSRGAHAHRALQQLIVAASGSFDVVLDDGRERRTVRLDDRRVGLRVVPMIWRDLAHFSADAVCLVLASLPYDEADYIRSYEQFVTAKYAGEPVSNALEHRP